MVEQMFYVPGQRNCIDAVQIRNGVPTGQFSGETLEQIQVRYPGATIVNLDEVSRTIEEMCKKPWQEITEERFFYLLEVLPPLDWRRRNDCESFKMCEFTHGRITQIVVRRGAKFYSCEDTYTLKHDELMASLDAHLTAAPATADAV